MNGARMRWQQDGLEGKWGSESVLKYAMRTILSFFAISQSQSFKVTLY